MNGRRIVFIMMFLFCFAPLAFSFGKKEKAQEPPKPQIVQVTGIVRLVGSAMFPEIVISGIEHNTAEAETAGELVVSEPANNERVFELPSFNNRGTAEWYVAAEEMDKLHNLQHRRVTVEGEETVRELTFANGLSAGIRRELRNIRIISVE